MYQRSLHFIIAILLAVFSTTLLADDLSEGLVLSNAPINRNDVDSIKRGAKFFANTCMSCHTMIYLRYNKLASEAGVQYSKMPINVKDWPNGVKPPDLSSEANVRGVDWLYTYLHSFYPDTKTLTGANNLLVPGTAMPNIIGPYQGEQVLVKQPIKDLLGHLRWYDLLELKKQGSMTPEQFDATTADIVNFLAYAAEPFRAEQHRIGWWVLAFLSMFFVLMYALKRSYWQDVKQHSYQLNDNKVLSKDETSFSLDEKAAK